MSVKLLDFVPPPSTASQAPVPANVDGITRVKGDSLYTCTPDMPRLRFAGPQYVFLWDDLTNMNGWHKMGLDRPKDVRVDLFLAFTQKEYMPMKNLLAGRDQARCYLPLDKSWPNKVRGVEVESFKSLTPKKIAGKLVSCGLKAMMAFDQYYCNTVLFDRVKLPIENPSKKTVHSAWVYVNRLSQICKFDPHEMEYRFGSNQDMIPFPCSQLHGQHVFDSAYLNQQVIDQGVAV